MDHFHTFGMLEPKVYELRDQQVFTSVFSDLGEAFGFSFWRENSPVKVHSLIEIPLPINYLMLGDD